MSGIGAKIPGDLRVIQWASPDGENASATFGKLLRLFVGPTDSGYYGWVQAIDGRATFAGREGATREACQMRLEAAAAEYLRWLVAAVDEAHAAAEAAAEADRCADCGAALEGGEYGEPRRCPWAPHAGLLAPGTCEGCGEDERECRCDPVEVEPAEAQAQAEAAADAAQAAHDEWLASTPMDHELADDQRYPGAM